MRTKSLANAAIGVLPGAVLGGILLATVGHPSGHNVLLVLVPMALTGALLLALSLKRHDESEHQSRRGHAPPLARSSAGSLRADRGY